MVRTGDREELIIGEIDLSEGYRVRDYIPYLKDRKPMLYGELSKPMDSFG